MINLDKKDLKLKIQDLYCDAIDGDSLDSIIGLDIVKSVSGIDIDNINPKLLNWYIANYHIPQKNKLDVARFDKIPAAISFFNLEDCLLEKKYKQALESVYHLSVVSEGRQVLEFFIEFSLKYTESAYRYIWSIFRMQVFLDSKTMLSSLNKCVDLIISSKITNSPYDDSSDIVFNWTDYLSCEIKDVNDLFLLYSIYNSKLIRSFTLKKIIAKKLLTLEIGKYGKLKEICIDPEQSRLGRKWILSFINNHKILNFDRLEILNNARNSLMLSCNKEETDFIWKQINNKL